MAVKPILTTLHSLSDWRTARRRLATELKERGCSSPDLRAILLATHEATKNALQFSGKRPVYVTLHIEHDRVIVCITDSGEGFDRSRSQPAFCSDPQGSSGRGLELMHRLMDRVEVVPQQLGCTVRMTKRLTLSASE